MFSSSVEIGYIESQIDVCAFSESRVFICISSHNPQIFANIQQHVDPV